MSLSLSLYLSLSLSLSPSVPPSLSPSRASSGACFVNKKIALKAPLELKELPTCVGAEQVGGRRGYTLEVFGISLIFYYFLLALLGTCVCFVEFIKSAD